MRLQSEGLLHPYKTVSLQYEAVREKSESSGRLEVMETPQEQDPKEKLSIGMEGGTDSQGKDSAQSAGSIFSGENGECCLREGAQSVSL